MEWIKYNTERLKSKYLFKFLSEENLMKFITTGSIWFSRSDKFGDKMECVMLSDLDKDTPDFSIIEKRKRKHFISCFHYGLKETLAFWDTYSKNEEDRRKYALRFDRIKLIELIENSKSLKSIVDIKELVHGRVKYRNLIDPSSDSRSKNAVKYSAFRKEYVFNYEREYRFDINLKTESRHKGFKIQIGNMSNIPFSILVNPLLENNDYIKCIEKLEQEKLNKYFELSSLTKWLKPELWK